MRILRYLLASLYAVAALAAASASLGSNMTPETEKYFVRYRAKIARQLVKENKQLQEPLNIPDNVFED